MLDKREEVESTESFEQGEDLMELFGTAGFLIVVVLGILFLISWFMEMDK